jgi:hypothetical protein
MQNLRKYLEALCTANRSMFLIRNLTNQSRVIVFIRPLSNLELNYEEAKLLVLLSSLFRFKNVCSI